MGGTVFLLIFVLATSVNSDEPTVSTTYGTTSSDALDKGDVALDDQKSSTVAVSTTEADPIKVDESVSTTEADPIKADESVSRYVFADPDSDTELKKSQSQGNESDTTGNEEAELEMFEAFMNETEKILDDIDYRNPTTIDDDNGQLDTDAIDEEDDEKLSTDTVETYIVNDSGMSVNRQGDINPGYEQLGEDIEDIKPSGNNAESSDPIYVSVNDDSDSGDNAPLLLTQGGYQRPYQRLTRVNSQRQRMRAESASQQSETLENPPNNPSQPQALPPVNPNPFQQMFGFGIGPFFPSPFMPVPGFVDGNAVAQSAQAPNGYFNAPPTGFVDFSQPNFQGQFVPSDASGIPSVQRNPSPFPSPMFQAQPNQFAQTPGFMFQGPLQIPPMNDPMRSNGFNFFTFPAPAPAPAPVGDVAGTTAFGRPVPISFQTQTNPSASGGPFQSPYAGPSASDSNSPVNFLNRFRPSGDRSTLNSRFPDSYATAAVNQDTLTPQTVVKVVDDDVSSIENTRPEVQSPLKKDDSSSVPFGTRILKNGQQDQSVPSSQRDVYIRYPLTEAGYATEESLPVQNTTEKNTGESFTNSRPVFPFFTGPRQFPDYSNTDPYRNALNSLQRVPSTGSDYSPKDDKNDTQDSVQDQFSRGSYFPYTQPLLSRPPAPLFADRNQGVPQFYPNSDATGNPFDLPVFRDNYQIPTAISTGSDEQNSKVPACAQQTNYSLCFDDPEYPKRDLLYALSSDSFMMDRFVAPNQRLDGIDLVDQDTSESPDSQDNYICKSDIKKGLPLRAKNVNGDWKVVVNVERAIGNGKFVQPVRLEMCRGANEPCSFTTEVKTSCVQKYSLQRLLSWSQERGIHTDVYKLPMACSCQIVRE